MSTIDPAELAYEACAGVYDEINAHNDYEMWFGELLPRLEQLGLRRGGLLDVACGTGRAIDPMLRRGWKVSASDISAAMVDKAKEKHPEVVSFDVCDMRELPVYGSFELVWALNDAVNYLLGDGDLARAFAAMAGNLADEGLLVFDCNTQRLFREFFGGDPAELGEAGWIWAGHGGDGTFFEAELSGEKIVPHLHRERYWSVDEVTTTLREVGLIPLGAFGQRETETRVVLGDDWDEDRDHKIIHVARKH